MNRSLLALLTLVAFVAVSTVAPGPSQGSVKPPRCGQSGTKTYYEKGTMRMYMRRDYRMYACSSKFGGSAALAPCAFSYECFSKDFMWDGRFLLYRFTNVGATAIYGGEVYLADLKTGKDSGAVWPKHPGIKTASFCNATQPCMQSPRSFAKGWGPKYAIGYEIVSEPYGPYLPFKSYVIESHCWSKELTFDHADVLDRPSTPKDLKSLRVRFDRGSKANIASWTNNGKQKSAKIC